MGIVNEPNRRASLERSVASTDPTARLAGLVARSCRGAALALCFASVLVGCRTTASSSGAATGGRDAFEQVPALAIEAPDPQNAPRRGRDDGRRVDPVAREASPPAGGPFRYSYEQLKSGDLDKILTGSGPLWSPEEQEAYHAIFTDIPPYIIRFGVSIVPTPRRTNTELVRMARDFLVEYAGQIPLFTIKWDVTDSNDVARGLCREVLGGELDETLKLVAGILRDAGRPVFVRIGPEVNGPWNNYDPNLYPRAYRYIADLLEREGCDQLIKVWNLKYVPGQDPSAYLDFYPGDEHVDWWSLDLFTEDLRSAEGREWVSGFLAQARRHGKPVIIPESCPNGMDLDSDRTWSQWFQPYFDLINGDTNIKGFCYSNRDFEARDVRLTAWGDMRIDQHALADRWRAELTKPQYLKARPEAAEAVQEHYAQQRAGRADRNR